MWLKIFPVFALVYASTSASAAAQQQSATIAIDNGVVVSIDGGAAICSDFRREVDGSWTPLKEISITATDGCSAALKPGAFSLEPGIPMFCGADIGLALNRQCMK
jgi:hypothetical protein